MDEQTQNVSRKGLNYRQWLASELAERKLRNPAFSLRSFSKKLGMSPTSLSLLLGGKRPLTANQALRIADRLNLSPPEKNALIEAAQRKRGAPTSDSEDGQETDSFLTLEVDTFKVISDWYHYAILSLAEVTGSQASPQWLSDRLGVPSARSKKLTSD